ncbi:MAG: bifunctional diguanylate cyclase/phosphodiesterase [Pseudoflavonifractor sp.]
MASHFAFERGYIFETDPGGKTTTNTFEWCAEGVTSEIDNLQHVPIEAATTANDSFRRTGIFVLKSLEDLQPSERVFLEPQGIQSMVQFGIFSKGLLLGFIGFDNCRGGALRNDAEVDEIATICNILATFFVKHRSEETFLKDTQVQLDVMNHLNNYVYVVNAATLEVLFMNHQAKKRMGLSGEGTLCYRFFKDRETRCPDCPIQGLEDGQRQRYTREGYNKKLDIWLETSASTLRWTDGLPCYLLECADITQQKKEHLHHINQLETLAFVDELTGSPTFHKFKMEAQKILEQHRDGSYFLVKLDIENFKLINQIYGYEKGDDILCCLACAIRKTVRREDEIFARVSNDEFVALLSMEDGGGIAPRYDAFLSGFYHMLDPNFAFKFTFACGVYVIRPEDLQELNIKDLFEKVNVAHKTAKQDKSNQYVTYSEAMIEKALRTKEIENKMAHALESGEFAVYLQPKYRLCNETICGAEALSRWQNANKDLFFPDCFIPVFERNGFITRLDFYVLRRVCCIIRDWLAAGIPPVVVSVNFSRLHLSSRSFVRELCNIVDEVGIPRRLIEIEITETAIYDNIETLRVLLDDLHKSGFTMSMDDFGRGYSSLGMLKDLPVDVIKMDGSFFANQKDAARSKIVVGSIIKMAEDLGIRIVAEGVEDREDIDLLRELHCDMVQGYYYARPMPAAELITHLRGNGAKALLS